MNAFADFFHKRGDHTRLRGAKRGAAEVVSGLLQRRFRTQNGEFGPLHTFLGAGQGGLGGQKRSLGLVVFSLRNDLLFHERGGTVKGLFRRQLIRLPLDDLRPGRRQIGLGGIQSGFSPQQCGFVDVRVQLNQEVPFVDGVPFLDGKLGDLAVDFGRDFHFNFRLDFSAGTDAFDDGPKCQFFRCDGGTFAVAPFHHGDAHEQDHQRHQANEYVPVHVKDLGAFPDRSPRFGS